MCWLWKDKGSGMSTYSKNHKKVPNSVWKKKQNAKKASRKYQESQKRQGESNYGKIYYLKPWKRSHYIS